MQSLELIVSEILHSLFCRIEPVPRLLEYASISLMTLSFDSNLISWSSLFRVCRWGSKWSFRSRTVWPLECRRLATQCFSSTLSDIHCVVSILVPKSGFTIWQTSSHTICYLSNVNLKVLLHSLLSLGEVFLSGSYSVRASRTSIFTQK